MQFRIHLKIIPFLLISTQTSAQLNSPCPNIFEYESFDESRWHGTLTFQSDAKLIGSFFTLGFDKPILKLNTLFGNVMEHKTRPNYYVIGDRNIVLHREKPLKIHFLVSYNESISPPKLNEIILNGRRICPEYKNHQVTQPVQETLSAQSIYNLILMTQKGFISPCPQIFQYEKNSMNSEKNNFWFGTITLLSDKELHGVWLMVILDSESLQFGNSYTTVKPEDEDYSKYSYLMVNRTQVVQPNVPIKVRFFVMYESEKTTPKLIGIRFNGKTICERSDDSLEGSVEDVYLFTTEMKSSGPNVGELSTVAVRTSATQPSTEVPITEYFLNEYNVVTPRIQKTRATLPQPCGIVANFARPLITYGRKTVQGEFPWHVALYRIQGVDLTYACGGNLISLSHVLTVAHCVTLLGTNKLFPLHKQLVYLGKFNALSNIGIQQRELESVVIHPEYDPHILKNDIALIKLSTLAEFTDYVRPICLWSGGESLQRIVGQGGTVVGWGLNERRIVNQELAKAQMPVVSLDTCLLSDPFYALFASARSFCAGGIKNISSCNGDSGGGMIFPLQTHSSSLSDHQIWQLRGLVSTAVNKQGICDNSKYVLFTDVAKYLDWIRENQEKLS